MLGAALNNTNYENIDGVVVSSLSTFGVRLFKTAAFDCSRSGSASTPFDSLFFSFGGFDIGNGLLNHRRHVP